MVSADDIRPHPKNARRGNAEKLAQLIRKNGFYGHCIVQRSTGFILIGNHRYAAGKLAGMTEFPVL